MDPHLQIKLQEMSPSRVGKTLDREAHSKAVYTSFWTYRAGGSTCPCIGLGKGSQQAFQPQEFLPTGNVALQAEGWATQRNSATVFPCVRETNCDPESVVWKTQADRE